MEKPVSELITVEAEREGITPEQLEQDIIKDNERFAKEDQELAVKELNANPLKPINEAIVSYRATDRSKKYPWPEKVITIESVEVTCTVTSANQKLVIVALCTDGKTRRFKWHNYYYGHSNPYIQPDAGEDLEIEEL